MRAAICSVGLVSPRSTWESMGADTPERSARSRNERSIASRSALTRGPTAATVGSAAAAITPVRYHVRSRRRCGEAHTGRPRRAGSLGAMERPDVLVLGAGGTLGEAWMRGLLSGLDDGGGPDLRECASFVGTSAGSIVAATLAAGERLEAGDHAARDWAQEAQDEPERLTGVARQAARAGLAVAGPLAHFTLTAAAPAGRLARAAALRAAPRPGTSLAGLGRHIESLGARFDGRLRIAAVDRASGRRVVFGEPDAPRASVADAVLASCAVPWIFSPVQIGEREYVDGGVWSLTNLDVAPAAGPGFSPPVELGEGGYGDGGVWSLPNPDGAPAGRGGRGWCLIPPAGPTIAPLRRTSTAGARAEALALRSRGARVRIVVPD